MRSAHCVLVTWVSLQVSLLFLSNGAVEVLRTDGDNHLGGEDFDLKIIQWLEEQRAAGQLPCLGDEVIHEEAEKVLSCVHCLRLDFRCHVLDGLLRARRICFHAPHHLNVVVSQTKLALSDSDSADVSCMGRDGKRHTVTLTRKGFDEITADLVERVSSAFDASENAHWCRGACCSIQLLFAIPFSTRLSPRSAPSLKRPHCL